MTRTDNPGQPFVPSDFWRAPLSAQLGAFGSHVLVKGLARAYPDPATRPTRLSPEVLRRCFDAALVERYLPECPPEGLLPFTEEDERAGAMEMFGTHDEATISRRVVGIDAPALAGA